MMLDDARGFSLLELLVASAIFFSFMVGMTAIYSQSHRTYRRGQSRIEVQQTGRVALEILLREIRLAGYDPSGAIPLQAAPTPIQVATGSTLTLLADVDRDGVTDRVTYRRLGAQLLRERSSWNGSSFPPPTADQLASGVSQLGFAYFDESAALTAPVVSAELASIRRVSIELLATHQAVDVIESYPLTVDVSLRNAE